MTERKELLYDLVMVVGPALITKGPSYTAPSTIIEYCDDLLDKIERSRDI